jgi:hypothetical protein
LSKAGVQSNFRLCKAYFLRAAEILSVQAVFSLCSENFPCAKQNFSVQSIFSVCGAALPKISETVINLRFPVSDFRPEPGNMLASGNIRCEKRAVERRKPL